MSPCLGITASGAFTVNSHDSPHASSLSLAKGEGRGEDLSLGNAASSLSHAKGEGRSEGSSLFPLPSSLFTFSPPESGHDL